MRTSGFALVLLGCHVQTTDVPHDRDRLATTYFGSCTITDDNSVECWGESVWASVDASLRSLDLGLALSCALSTTGEVWCRKDSGEGWRVLGLRDPTQVDVGIWTACAVHSGGKVSCWNDTSADVIRIRGVSEAVQVEVGSYAACARSRDGRVWCWWQYRRSARQLLAIDRAVDIAVGDEIWILDTSGVVTAIEARPGTLLSGIHRTQVSGLVDAIDVEGWELVGCARRKDGGVACWESDVGFSWSPLPPWDKEAHEAGAIPQLHDIVELSVGGMHACARERDGTISCWGSNWEFELGDASGRSHVGAPNRIEGLPPVTEIHMAERHACAVSHERSLWCWGGVNWSGVPGILSAAPGPVQTIGLYESESSVHIHELTTVEGLLVGDDVDCAQFSPTLLRCWNDDALAISHPRGEVAIPSGTQTIDLGPRWGCMAGSYGVQCFGSPSYANANEAWHSDERSPASVRPPSAVAFPKRVSATEVVVGRDHACALLDDRSVWCWGDNAFAQVGAQLPRVRAQDELEIPVATVGIPELLTLSAGSNHTCGLDAEGMAWCWGDANVPATDGGRVRAVVGLPPLRELAAGNRHTCAIALDDTVWCWESGAAGSRVPELQDIVELDAHGQVDCALDRSGAVHCWGDNQQRVADPSSPLSSSIPIEVAPSRKRRIGGTLGRE
jgi:hypothetical protein